MKYAFLVLVVLLAGCAAEEDVAPKSWSDGPYYKVLASGDSIFEMPIAEGFVRGEVGDRLVVKTVPREFSTRRAVNCVYVVRKDKTRFILPFMVNKDGVKYRISIIHLVDKTSREFDFLTI